MAKKVYSPELCAELIAHMKKGHSFESFGAVAKVSHQAMDAWVKKYPEFAEAKEIGFTESLLYWETIGIHATRGLISNFAQSTYIFLMKCRFKRLGYNENANTPAEEPGDEDISREPTERLLKLIRRGE